MVCRVSAFRRPDGSVIQKALFKICVFSVLQIPGDSNLFVVAVLQSAFDQVPGMTELVPWQFGKKVMFDVKVEIEQEEFSDESGVVA